MEGVRILNEKRGFGMTNEEAIDELRYQEKLRGKGINYQVDNLVISAAVSALEKQIAKKPIPHIVNAEKIKTGNGYCGKGTTIYYCPNCKDFISRMYTYCHKCGQKLLWE